MYLFQELFLIPFMLYTRHLRGVDVPRWGYDLYLLSDLP